MLQHLSKLNVKVLERIYMKEGQVLKFKLLTDATSKIINKRKNKAIALALTIHDKNY